MEDDQAMLAELTETLELENYRVWQAETGAAAKARLSQGEPDAILLDLQLPDIGGLELLPWIVAQHPTVPVVIGTAYASIDKAVRAIKLGAYDFVEKTVQRDQFLIPIRNALEKRRLQFVQADLLTRLREGREIIAESPAMRRLLAEVAKIGPSEERVLITGESGTGKEVLADAVQARSPRASQPYVKLSCAAIPRELVESELFGYERGAHSTAFESRTGLFQRADGGTLLLDDIAEMDLKTQAKVLRVVQEGEFLPVGSQQASRVDVRIIAATNRDLVSLIKSNEFRDDLFYRLRGVTLRIPPLRERTEDILPLMELSLARAAKRNKKPPLELSRETRAFLLSQPWPGNVRDLESLAARLTVFVAGPEIQVADLESWFDRTPDGHPLDYRTAKSRWERDYLRLLAMACKGNKTKMAEVAGMDRAGLHRKFADLEIEDISLH